MANPFLSKLIAARLKFRKGSSFSSNVIRISTISIALGTSILVLAALIQAGFREEINRRIFSFGGHMSLRQFSSGTLYEELPMSVKDSFLTEVRKIPEVAGIQAFSYKPALLSNEKEVAGVILKGIDKDFNLNEFSASLDHTQKSIPAEDQVWISRKMARKLQLKTGQTVVAFFLQEPPRYRKLKVNCLYQTGLEDVDDNIAFVSIGLIREINGWEPGTAGGFEIRLHDFSLLPQGLQAIGSRLPFNLGLEPITYAYSQLFEWLDVIGRNVLVMFILVSMVAGFNMAATLLIMVMERRQMIGILKALGAEDSLIRNIFVRNGLRIMIRGMLAGNILALGFALIQWKFQLIPLNPDNYYLSSVPVGWDFTSVAGINTGVILITWLVILIPVKIVNRIRPAEAVRA